MAGRPLDSPERGQILALFTVSLFVLLLMAALAFDVGMMLVERRDQQNAADAAALAGARYLTNDGSGTPRARAEAYAMAEANGFPDTAPIDVQVHIPPIHGLYRGQPGFIEVQIHNTRTSIFGGIIGRANWPVGSMGVAANQQGVSYSFGMLALSETACKAIHVSGTGTVYSKSSIQSNSTGADCAPGDPYGISRSGSGTIVVDAPDGVCRTPGQIQDQGNGSMTCDERPGGFALPDPLRDLPAPAKPALAPPVKEVVSGSVVDSPSNIPDHCPGATPASKAPSETNPRTCVMGQGNSQANRHWILSPGLYPAGLDLKGGVTVYLLPGIYWIGGGGFQTSNNASVISVNSETDRARATCTQGATPPCVNGGGILIYNSKLPASAAGPISLGGGGATLSLQPYDYPFGSSTIDLVIFQDRTVTQPVTLNGSDSQATEVRGIVYVPEGSVTVNGSNSVFSMDQIIADTFKVNGSGGTVNVLRETGVDVLISAVGLVE